MYVIMISRQILKYVAEKHFWRNFISVLFILRVLKIPRMRRGLIGKSASGANQITASRAAESLEQRQTRIGDQCVR